MLTVTSLGRLDLEALVQRSLEEKRPILESDVRALVVKPPVNVRIGLEHVAVHGAGLISLLPLELLVDVCMLVPLEQRLSLAIAVCKGLRLLREEAPSLWARFDICKLNGPRAWPRPSYHQGPWINKDGLLRLLAWVPDRSAVHSLRLHCDKGGPFSDVADVLKSFPDVTELQLTGSAINKQCLAALASVARPGLRRLMLDAGGNIGDKTWLATLAAAPGLESLSTLKALGKDVLSMYAAKCREARSGQPLLTRLETRETLDGLGLGAFCQLGKRFPELTDLCTRLTLGGAEHGADGLSYRPPFAPMANLRRLTLNHLIYFAGDHLSSGSLGDLLGLILPACPRLECLAIDHGIKYTSSVELKRDGQQQLPALAGALTRTPLPSSLVLLQLQNILVTPSDFDECHLPELTLVRLLGCGPAALEVARQLAESERCPKLRGTEQVEVVDLEGLGYLGQVVTPDRNEQRADERMHLIVPRVTLAGLSHERIQAMLSVKEAEHPI